MTHQPRKGDKFWDQARHVNERLQPDGYILAVWNNDDVPMVTVKFYDSKGNAKYHDYYVADILGNYRNELMGWMLYAD